MQTGYKKFIGILTMALLCVSTNTYAQELVGKLYQTKVPILVRSVYNSERLKTDFGWKDLINGSGTELVWPDSASSKTESGGKDSIYCEAKKGYIFQVIDIKDNRVLIRWWDFTDSSRARQARKDSLTSKYGVELISFRNTHLDYEISLTDLNAKCSPYYGNDNSFTWGAVTMPIKLRLGNKSDRYFSFQESLNIGIAGGWSWQKEGRHQKSTNVLFSVGISNVVLDSLDFKRNSKNESYQPDVKSTAAITIAAGYVFQFDGFQVGAFTGLDILPYDLGRQWLHKNKPWIGFGLGMSLFNRNQPSAGSGKNLDK